MPFDFKGLWNLKDPRLYVLLCGVVLLVLGGLGSLPAGKQTLPIKHPLEIVLFVFGGALAFASGLAIVLRPVEGSEPNTSKGKITFGLRDLLGENAKDLKINYKSLTTVDALLDTIYYSIGSRVAAGTYGEQWIIRKDNGEPFHTLGTVWAQLFNEPNDYRSPRDVGMEPGMKFEVKRHKQPLLLINPAPNAGKKAVIQEIRYEDLDEVDGLLNKIGASVLPTQSSTTYGVQWVLRDAASGKTLNDIGPEWARRNKQPRDARGLAQAGMAKNMQLQVVFKTPQPGPVDATPEGRATFDNIGDASPPKT